MDKKYEFINLQYGDVDNEIRQLDKNYETEHYMMIRALINLMI
jgi:hypothetical protein